MYTIHRLSTLYQGLSSTVNSLCTEALYLLLHGIVLLNKLGENSLKVLSIVEHCLQITQRIFECIDCILACFTCHSFYSAYSSSHTALSNNLEETDTTC